MEIALLTSAITINKEIVGHKKISENERLQQYVNALIFYITQSNFDVLIFCDGTNYDINQLQFLSNLANLYGKQVEFLSFQQNLQKVIEKGKGYGEQEIIKYAIEHSSRLSKEIPFYKITGRYIVKNINTILQNEKKQKNLFFRTFFFGMCCTAFFRCTPTFRERYLQPATKDISNKKDEIIEHIYIKYLKGNQYIKSFKELPRFEGITGAGHSLHMPYLLWITREICNKLGTLKI